MVRSPSALLVVIALAGCAGAQHPWSKQVLCEMEMEHDGPPRRHQEWLALLLRGYDPATRRVTSPAIDCTNTQIRWDAPVVACSDGTKWKTPLPDRPLSEREVVVAPAGDDLWLVWVQTSRFASGDSLGPVAIVEMKSRRLVVRAIGALRANPTRTRLRLDKLGEVEMLVADGESCVTSDPASCQRAARLLPLRGERFMPEPLISRTGECVSAAWFDLAREESETVEGGVKRRYRLDAALTFGPGALQIEEQLAIHDLDPRKPQAPPRLLRHAQGTRTVELVGGRMVTVEKPLWGRVVKGTE